MMKQEEDEEEERKVQEYLEIGMRLMNFPQDVMKARKLVVSFIRSAEEVEEDEKESLDLLYRRVEQEGLIRPSLEADDLLLRVDFVREVDALLQEVRAEQNELLDVQGFPGIRANQVEAANHSTSRISP